MKIHFNILKMPKEDFVILLIIFSLLKCLLFYLIFEVIITPQQVIGYVPDSQMYETAAKNLISGNGFSFNVTAPFTPTMFKEPLYAFFIAFIYLFFGQISQYIIIFQMFLSPLIAIFIYLIGKEIFEERIARLSSLLTCLMPIFGDISFFIQVDAIYIPLVLFSVFLLIKTFKIDTLRFYLFSGALLGALALSRSLVFYLPCLVIFLIASGYGKGLKFNYRADVKGSMLKILTFILSFTIIVSPWIIRNIKQFKTFQISERGGRIMWAQATMAESFNKDDLKAYFLYLFSGKLAQKKYPDFIGDDLGNFEYRWMNKAPFSELKEKGFTDGQIDLILARAALKKVFLHPIKFIVFSSISYLQIFKYFVPWSIITLEGGKNIFGRFFLPATRFLLGFPLGVPFTVITCLGLYFSRKLWTQYLIILVFILYYHLVLYFLSSVPGSTLQRYILPVIPLYSFFVCIFLVKICKGKIEIARPR